MPSSPDPVLRVAARVVILDSQDRVLLLRFTEPPSGRTWWATPGGALEPGETHQQAARRELLEETGLAGVELSPVIWTREHVFAWRGRRYRQQERFFMTRIDRHELGAELREAHLRDGIDAHRWWTIAELEQTGEVTAPRRLARLLRRLLVDGPPGEPIDTGL
ncbi:MAG TPA: NUDIX domain-containing protein [Actinomycetes bacterium]|jgi:ADP-ribose pyrophosphatase YjhB (NUDIX family)|nr:NUDIX domain-containing protein [Actinomycetes bacterium]